MIAERRILPLLSAPALAVLRARMDRRWRVRVALLVARFRP